MKRWAAEDIIFVRKYKSFVYILIFCYISRSNVHHTNFQRATRERHAKGSIADIANLTGFEDQSYFSRIFKQIVGVSPGKYRESTPPYSKSGSHAAMDPRISET